MLLGVRALSRSRETLLRGARRHAHASAGADGVLRVRRQPEIGVVTLTLNRPAARNALSLQLLEELNAELEALAQDVDCAQTRAVVIQAEGPCFSSGHDLKEMTAPGYSSTEDELTSDLASSRRALFELCSRVMEQVESVPQAVIAAVHGTATAAGCQLVAACDLAVCTKNARFATPGVSIGLFCSTPAVPLVRCVGRKPAMDMLLTGRAVSADEAKAMGLVSHVSSSEEAGEIQAVAAELAASIAERSGTALAIGKRTVKAQAGLPLHEAYQVATEAMTVNMDKEDAREGIDAFINKRQPTWTHR